METPKNLLNGNTSKDKPQLPRMDDKKLLKEGEENGGGRGWWMFIIGLVVGAALMWVFAGNKSSEDVIPKENNDSAIEESESTLANTESAATASNSEESTTKQSQISNSPASSANEVSGADSISVKDQSAGSNVDLDNFTISGTTWVAIHEDKDGALGNILGARRFDRSVKSGVVELLRNTVAGGTYHAVLYRDNGDGEFSKTTDSLVKNAAGVTIDSVFKTN